jgi:hypothetical protein
LRNRRRLAHGHHRRLRAQFAIRRIPAHDPEGREGISVLAADSPTRPARATMAAMPFYRCTIDPPLTVKATAERLRSLIGPKPTLRERFAAPLGDAPARPPFAGNMADGGFTATRILWYKNSFVPVIRGEYATSETGGTRMELVMTIHPFAIAFDVLWCVLVLFATMPMIARGETPSDYLGLGMIAFAVVITIGGFYPEAIYAKRLIQRAMQA